MTRREFLWWSGAGAAAAVLAGGGWWMEAGRSREKLGRLAQALITDPESARSLGRAYLIRLPGRGSASELTRTLFARWPGRWFEAAPEEIREYLQGQIKEEYTRGETELIDGWVLSKTEARLCALLVRQPDP